MPSLREYITLVEALSPSLPVKLGRNYIIVASDHRGTFGQPPMQQTDTGQQFQLPTNMPKNLWVEKGEEAIGKSVAAELGVKPLRVMVWDTSIMGPNEKLMQDFILKDIMIAPDPKMPLLAGLMAQQQVWLSPGAARPQPETLKDLAGQAAVALNQPNLPQTQATFNQLKKTKGAVAQVQKELNANRVSSLVSKLTQGGIFVVGIELWPQVEAAV